MKKHLIQKSCLLLLSLLLCICLFFGLKANAATIYRKFYQHNVYNNYQQLILLNYSDSEMGLNSTYPFINFTYNDVDLGQTTHNLELKLTGENQLEIIDKNNSTNKYIYMTNFYLIFLQTGQYNDVWYYIYEVEINYNDISNLFFEIQNTTPIYYNSVGLNWSETTGPMQILFYGNLVNNYYETNQTAWTIANINARLKTVLQYPWDSDITGDIYASGYNDGYSIGHDDGGEDITPLNKVWNLLSGMFSAIGSIMSIELFPYVPVGLFFLVPLFFGVVGLILWIWRRN